MADRNEILIATMRNEYYMAKNAAVAQANLAGSIDLLERQIIKDVSALKVNKAGSLIGPKTNLKQANEIQKQLNRQFTDTYGAEARKTVTGFKKASKYVNSNWAELDGSLAFVGADAAMIRTMASQYYDEFAKYGVAAQSAINTAMYNSIAGQQLHSDLIKSISAALTGKYAKSGAPMTQYAELFAFDGMMNFSQATNLDKAQAGGFKDYLYYGNVMTTTRDFCVERVGGVFKRKVIDSWSFPWSGKSGPAMTHRGGYNCRHHWQPVDPDWIDEEDAQWLGANTADSVNTYFMAMDHLAPFGVKQGSKGAQFVEALIAQPMTNAQIKALPWNKTGNLHGDIFKKLKDKGLAGTTAGKKWISAPGTKVPKYKVTDELYVADVTPKQMFQKLGGLNKNYQGQGMHQMNADPNLDKIFNKGDYTVTGMAKPQMPKMMADGECHWNTAKLYKDGEIDNIVVGYTSNADGWHQHTWGLLEKEGGILVETTSSNMINTAYYGYKLTLKEAEAYADFILDPKHKPGMGFVGTKKGGSIDEITAKHKKKAKAPTKQEQAHYQLDQKQEVDMFGNTDAAEGGYVVNDIPEAAEEFFDTESHMNKLYKEMSDKNAGETFTTWGDVDLDKLYSAQGTVEPGKVADIIDAKVAGVVGVDDPILVLRYQGKNIIWDGNHRANADLLLGKGKINARVVDLDKWEKPNITSVQIVPPKPKLKPKKKPAADEVTIDDLIEGDVPGDFGINAATGKGKFVQALIDQPMTNAEIKALPWNTAGNLHGDVFKKLKDQGYAGIDNGKKWISSTGKPPIGIKKLDTVMEEAAPTLAAKAKAFQAKALAEQKGKSLDEIVGMKKAVGGKPSAGSYFGEKVKGWDYNSADLDYYDQATNVHLTEIFDHNPNMKAHVGTGQPGIKELVLEKDMTISDGNGIVGMYSGGASRQIRLAGELSKEHTLTMGGYNVSGDFYGALRHEYSHHIWDTNLDSDLVGDWRALYYQLTDKNKNYFKKNVSSYSQSVEDAFAESFAAYTSPLYKKGKLPSVVENYFDHQLGGKKATYKKGLPRKRQITEKANPKRIFTDPRSQKKYEGYAKKYDKELAGTGAYAGEAAQKIYKRDIKNTWVGEAAQDWQWDTDNPHARLLKFKAEQIENRRIRTRISAMTPNEVAAQWATAEKLDSDAYLRMKALTAAYYKKRDIKTVTLYRGIGGDPGRAYADKVHRLKSKTDKKNYRSTKVLVEEDSMVGFSTNQKIAESFGNVVIERDVDVNDILLSDNTWWKESHTGETEFIMVGGDYEVPLHRIWRSGHKFE